MKQLLLGGRFEAPSSSSSLAARPFSVDRGALEPGPVFFEAGRGRAHVFRASKLVVDLTQVLRKSARLLTRQSFLYGTQRIDGEAFAPVRAALVTDGSPTIALPSRLIGSGPLSALRIAVKDIYAVKGASKLASSRADQAGLQMSAGNRAFYSIGAPSNVTAPAVARLLELGAQLVGMTKTFAFAAVRCLARSAL